MVGAPEVHSRPSLHLCTATPNAFDWLIKLTMQKVNTCAPTHYTARQSIKMPTCTIWTLRSKPNYICCKQQSGFHNVVTQLACYRYPNGRARQPIKKLLKTLSDWKCYPVLLLLCPAKVWDHVKNKFQNNFVCNLVDWANLFVQTHNDHKDGGRSGSEKGGGGVCFKIRTGSNRVSKGH